MTDAIDLRDMANKCSIIYTLRDSEGEELPLRRRVFSDLDIVGLQGLLIGEDEKFTQAIEAFEFKRNPDEGPCDKGAALQMAFAKCISAHDLYVKVLLAEKLCIPFSIWCRDLDDQDGLYSGRYLRGEHGDVEMVDRLGHYKERTFVDWWRKNKQTVQKKQYRKGRLDSYFDKLLEKKGLAWGGNIDGLIYDPVTDAIKAVVEVRCTEVIPLTKYDPAKFYYDPTKPNADDVATWAPVVRLAECLCVPCLLFTFDKTMKHPDLFGVSVVESADEKRLRYKDGIKPYQQLFKDPREVTALLDSL